jgi:FAD/FMN-containing dehydrogenase
MTAYTTLERELGAVVGAENVRAPGIADLEDATRWTGLRGTADAVVRPANAQQVADAVRWCYANDTPITVRGGGTGLSGGAVPEGGVVISLERLNRMRSLEPEWWRCEVEAGMTTNELKRRVREAGLRFPPDPGAAESSHIGGNIATNAGGPHTFGHGVTGTWVLGLEAVLAPGELVQIGGPLRKDVAGYDLKSLLIGSEGTLGVITAAWLRLVPPATAQQTVIALLPDLSAAQDAIQAALICGAVPASLELLDGGTLQDAGATLPFEAAVAEWTALPDPTTAVLLIASLEGDLAEATAARGDALVDAWQEAGAAWTAVPSATTSTALEAWRAGVAGAVAARRGGKLSEDVAVPTDRVAELISGSAAIARRHGLEHVAWGHAGDGNMHCGYLFDAADKERVRRANDAADELFSLTIALGGTVSGEHGLGRLKNGQLSAQWDPAAVAAHQAIKHALDPKGLLGPGRKLA